MKLQPVAGIEVHRVDIDLEAGDAPVAHWLAAGERARAARYARRDDRARFAQARAMLRRLLAARLGCRPESVALAEGPHGKPLVKGAGDRPPPFNVSHSGRYALIALADPAAVSEVGVDIECCRPDVDVGAVLGLAFTAAERGAVRADPDPLRALYARWTGKEAVLKACGLGIAQHLRQIAIHPEQGGGLGVVGDGPAWHGFGAMALPAPPGYAAALAWRRR